MKLEHLLRKKKTAIIKQWFHMVIDTYPTDTSNFIKKQKDPFSNPVGSTTYQGLEALLNGLIGGIEQESVRSFLDPIIRIRAVQSFTPSNACGFIFYLKKVIRSELKKDLQDMELVKELMDMEMKIDQMGMIGFDIYVECREKLYELKAAQKTNQSFSALKRAGLLVDPEAETETKPGT